MKIEQIPWAEFSFEVTRSRGPGGQNVNKTNSAVILRWNLFATTVFSEEQIQLLKNRLQNQLTRDGEILIRSDSLRDQDQNRRACLLKLESILKAALFIHKKRKATKPTKSSQRKRVDSKKIHANIKSNRKRLRTRDLVD